MIPFSDQIPSGLSDVLVRFAATHFAGAQKLLKEDDGRFRAYNRNWVLLHYQLGMGASPAEYIRGVGSGRGVVSQWSVSWPFVSSHESWFMHNQNGARHCGPKNYNCILNIADAEFQNWWIDEAIAAMRAAGAQGVFADTFVEGISEYDVTPPDVRFSGKNPANASAWPGGVNWLQQRVNWLNAIATRFRQTPERFLLVPNIASQATGWDTTDFAATSIDGAMLEGIALDTRSAGDWQLEMNRAMALTSSGKVVLFQTYPKGDQDSARFRTDVEFAVGSYLLVKGDYTYVNLSNGNGKKGTSIFYYPEYDVLRGLGRATGALPPSISTFAWAGAYRRQFEHGFVLVNPSAAPFSTDLGGRFRLLRCTGGGEVGAGDIDPKTMKYRGGTCRSADVSSVTVAPWSAAVLFDSTSNIR